ncbi:hypothetical protein E4U09_006472 [Claviceps aff. purpurea]|uniref:Probable acetate kinase n=1 Tax=Claviceps aff. purpurea TaxID=1967640 RepID=A0A9P7QAY8_9HYPO|nr:hypothetical protein E4U09_006472 [Claviceps aff. purpurea]
MKVILAINAGSSSVKISAYTAEQSTSPQQIAEAQVSGLTAPPTKLTYSRYGQSIAKCKPLDQDKADDQDGAFSLLLDTLIQDGDLREINSKSDIQIACHRIVHGGDYSDSHIINPDTYHHLERLSDLAPLHNGAALNIVASCIKQLPDATNMACFDSQFHSTIPAHISTYPINPAVAKNSHLRKYGFHGLSYAFITRSVAAFLGKEEGKLNIIALHLGSGASACAIRGGKSWDTSMGLTPLAGLPGATRSGSIDPSLVFHYASDVGKLSPASTKHLHISKAEEILNKQSGWKGLTGTTDFGEIASSSDPQHKLAFDIFVDRVCGFVGSYYVSLGGQVDALVFAGGIGEKSSRLRREVVRQMGCLGFLIDEERNEGELEGVVEDVGSAEGRHRVLVCRTDEQFEMARAGTEKRELW